jgi:hypothetical protein
LSGRLIEGVEDVVSNVQYAAISRVTFIGFFSSGSFWSKSNVGQAALAATIRLLRD